MDSRARSIGHIWLLWIRVCAFDWSDPDPDPLDRDLVNPDTVQYILISRSTRESDGTVAVRLRTSCSSCNSVTRYLKLTTSQFTPMHLHDSFLGLAFSSLCLRVTSSHLYAHFSSIYSCELKKKVSYSQQLSADLLHW